MATTGEGLQPFASYFRRCEMCVMTNINGSPVARTPAATSPAQTLAPVPLNYAQLVRRCMGKVELAERLLASFEQRFPQELAEIENCVSAFDGVKLTRLVHQLKGTAANVSADVLHAIVSRLEDSARNNHFDQVTAGLVDVRAAWAEFQNYKSSLPRTPKTASR
jgi:HPt (histidine-containing phosphotransfer) domain-containing protein